MSRRSHHRAHRGWRGHRSDTAPSGPSVPRSSPPPPPVAPDRPEPPADSASRPAPAAAPAAAAIIAPPTNGRLAPANDEHGAGSNGHAPDGDVSGNGAPAAAGCTAPQLRRFIKSRTWVPMHELRRRFGINGHEDDVTPLTVDGTTIFIGLPNREGELLGELLRGGDIGYELSLDPQTPIVIGVYPMRPVPRH
jgi:hypothetical protein